MAQLIRVLGIAENQTRSVKAPASARFTARSVYPAQERVIELSCKLDFIERARGPRGHQIANGSGLTVRIGCEWVGRPAPGRREAGHGAEPDQPGSPEFWKPNHGS